MITICCSQKTAYARRNGRFVIHATLLGTLYITGLGHKNVRSVPGVLQSSLTGDDWGGGLCVWSEIIIQTGQAQPTNKLLRLGRVIKRWIGTALVGLRIILYGRVFTCVWKPLNECACKIKSYNFKIHMYNVMWPPGSECFVTGISSKNSSWFMGCAV